MAPTHTVGWLKGLQRLQISLGAGRQAVVYNSPNYHLTSVSMFSCVLMSWGFQVTAVLTKPVEGFRQLLPCASDVITLHAPQAASDQIEHKRERKTFFNATVAEKLGLSLGTHSANGVGDEGEGRGGAATRSRGSVSFDVSVLCTAFHDLHALLNEGHHGFDSRLVGPVLWNVNVSIWNIHGVSRGFENGGVPPAAHDFAERVPSSKGKKPPPTFLTVYGEQVERWEELLEEAYEGWGPKPAPQEEGRWRKQETNLRGLFPHPGVVYPILPTGGMRLPRPSPGLFSSENDGSASVGGTRTLGETRRVRFVVQGIMDSARRDYNNLLSCLEAMCVEGRDNFSLDSVGSSGNLTEGLNAHPCVAARYTEGRHLDYNDFYARIVQGDFVVTAAAVDDYEYDRATSSIPTALLLEKPLVMASSLLHAYPCLWNSHVHSMVANDDLCLNLHGAYDLTPSEYAQMELEARDCKLAMWKQTRETVAELVLKGRLSGYS